MLQEKFDKEATISPQVNEPDYLSKDERLAKALNAKLNQSINPTVSKHRERQLNKALNKVGDGHFFTKRGEIDSSASSSRKMGTFEMMFKKLVSPTQKAFKDLSK
jgi:hypothetical protein